MKKLSGFIKSLVDMFIDTLVRQSLERNRDFLEKVKRGGYI